MFSFLRCLCCQWKIRNCIFSLLNICWKRWSGFWRRHSRCGKNRARSRWLKNTFRWYGFLHKLFWGCWGHYWWCEQRCHSCSVYKWLRIHQSRSSSMLKNLWLLTLNLLLYNLRWNRIAWIKIIACRIRKTLDRAHRLSHLFINTIFWLFPNLPRAFDIMVFKYAHSNQIWVWNSLLRFVNLLYWNSTAEGKLLSLSILGPFSFFWLASDGLHVLLRWLLIKSRRCEYFFFERTFLYRILLKICRSLWSVLPHSFGIQVMHHIRIYFILFLFGTFSWSLLFHLILFLLDRCININIQGVITINHNTWERLLHLIILLL